MADKSLVLDPSVNLELGPMLAKSSSVLIWISDLTKECRYFNRAWLEFRGRTLEQEYGHGWTEGVHPDDYDECLKIYVAAFDKRQPFSMDYRLMSSTGEYRWIRDDGSPYFDKDGVFKGYIGTCFDINENKSLEFELKSTVQKLRKANSAKSSFLANMSHEIRTPLNAIIGFSQTLSLQAKNMSLPDNFRAQIEHIKTAGDVLLELIDNVLDISKIESEKIEVNHQDINIQDFLNKILLVTRSQYQEKSLDLEALIDPTLPKVLNSDPKMLSRIFINLISNAGKFSPAGSTVTLYVKNKNDNMLIEVHDKGIGISKDDIDRIFGEFEQVDSSTTREYGGSGLGLAIVKRIVDALGGNIEVESEIEKGSIFKVYIPLQKMGAHQNQALNTESATSTQHKNILVAEDDEINRKIISTMLETSGVQINFANNGQEAIEKAKEMLQKHCLDMIMLDIHMPILDGTAAAKQLRESAEFDNIPIVAISADVFEKQKKLAYEAGFDYYLTKPIEMGSLVNVIETGSRKSTGNPL